MSKITEKLKALYNKIVREQASPEYIARGWAIGVLGVHMPVRASASVFNPDVFHFKGQQDWSNYWDSHYKSFHNFFDIPCSMLCGVLNHGKASELCGDKKSHG